MDFRLLGKSDLFVSRVGFGAMSLTPDNPDGETIVHRAVAAGINFYDTADMYQKGLNESLLGRILKSKRKEIILATKVGICWRQDGSGWDWTPSKKYIIDAIEKSLVRLQTDYIDLYQLHGGTLEDPIDEILEAFELLQKQGKIRHYGLSSIRPSVIREYVKRSTIVSVMMQYNLLDRRPEEEMLPFLQKNNIGVLARGALAKGLLVSKKATSFLNYSVDQVQKAALSVQIVSGKNRSPATAAVQFVLQNSAITSAVIGIRTLNQLNDIFRAVESEGLTEEEREYLTTSITQNYYSEHR
jgi:aryl-alcohol dehydrogenase-like predicted oxidoreductase